LPSLTEGLGVQGIDPAGWGPDDGTLAEFRGFPAVGATVIAAAINIARVTPP
jgi:hypothetical protein